MLSEVKAVTSYMYIVSGDVIHFSYITLTVTFVTSCDCNVQCTK